MNAYWLASSPNGSVLESRDVPVPEPGPSEVLVRMHAAALNRGELLARRDLHGATPARPAGNEGAGEVVRAGAAVTAFKTGDRVMGTCGGAFAEFAVMDERTAIRVPDGVAWTEAACIPLVFLVVYDMLIAHANLRAGEWLLVTGASSGVGVAAIQITRLLGAHSIGTSGSTSKLERLQQLGLDVPIETRAPSFAAAVRSATGDHGADVAINLVGGTMFPECVRALAFEGRLAVVGYVDGVTETAIDLATVHALRLQIFGVSALRRTMEQRIATVRGFVRDWLPFVADGRLRPAIDRVFAFADVPAAKSYMESNAHLGKIAVTIAS